MTAVECLESNLIHTPENELHFKHNEECWQQAKEMEKQDKISLLKSLVYSVCIGDDVENVEEWLQKHELNKSE